MNITSTRAPPPHSSKVDAALEGVRRDEGQAAAGRRPPPPNRSLLEQLAEGVLKLVRRAMIGPSCRSPGAPGTGDQLARPAGGVARSAYGVATAGVGRPACVAPRWRVLSMSGEEVLKPLTMR